MESRRTLERMKPGELLDAELVRHGQDDLAVAANHDREPFSLVLENGLPRRLSKGLVDDVSLLDEDSINDTRSLLAHAGLFDVLFRIRCSSRARRSSAARFSAS
jgi:hypothetical protein